MAKGKNRQFQGNKKKGRAREFRAREVRRQKLQHLQTLAKTACLEYWMNAPIREIIVEEPVAGLPADDARAPLLPAGGEGVT